MYRPYASAQREFRPLPDVDSQLREQTQDFVTSFNTGNYDHAARLFANDGVLMAPQYEGAHGQRQVEHLLRQMGEFGYGGLRMETTRVEHSGDMAMELGRFSITIRRAEGAMVPSEGKYVRVWRRLGAWLVMADCWNLTAQTVNDRAA